MGHHGGSAHAIADQVAGVGAGSASSAKPLVDDPLQLGRQPEPAVALGKVDPRQTGVELVAEELNALGGLGVMLRKQLVEFGLDKGFLSGWPSSRRPDSRRPDSRRPDSRRL